MTINTFLLFIAFGLFSTFSLYANIKAGNNLVKNQFYILMAMGLCGMIYLLITSLKG